MVTKALGHILAEKHKKHKQKRDKKNSKSGVSTLGKLFGYASSGDDSTFGEQKHRQIPLLQEVTSPKKKPAGGAGTGITIKIRGTGAAKAADPTAKKPSGGGSKAKSPEAVRAKSMSDLLKHVDEMAIFSRQKAMEHGTWESFHNKSRVDRHLGPLHKEAREGFENLRKVYGKISNEAYRISKPKDKYEKKDDKKEKPKAKKKKTLKECFDLNEFDVGMLHSVGTDLASGVASSMIHHHAAPLENKALSHPKTKGVLDKFKGFLKKKKPEGGGPQPTASGVSTSPLPVNNFA